ncbi:MAG TPA: pseudouridine synthase [Deltaproteobacteria bacterium]|nr:pseudouridine synthase [Deltaproteobacteria bacterium]
MERLQKTLSRAGVSSRRHAEAMMAAGRVRVNGRVVRELGSKADPERDEISVDGKPLHRPKIFHYYSYYKPRGIVVSKRDEFRRDTVFDLLKLPRAVNAVGRLDKDSEGLLLLTDDGTLLQRYTHPSFGVKKVYRVQVSRLPDAAERNRMREGIRLEEKQVRALAVKNLELHGENWIEIVLGEGIKREIRRMLETFSIQVLRLIRIRHGEVELGSLAPGQCVEWSRSLLKKVKASL